MLGVGNSQTSKSERIEVGVLRKAMDNLTPVLGECNVNLILYRLKQVHGLDLVAENKEQIEIAKCSQALEKELGEGTGAFIFNMLKKELSEL